MKMEALQCFVSKLYDGELSITVLALKCTYLSVHNYTAAVSLYTEHSQLPFISSPQQLHALWLSAFMQVCCKVVICTTSTEYFTHDGVHFTCTLSI